MWTTQKNRPRVSLFYKFITEASPPIKAISKIINTYKDNPTMLVVKPAIAMPLPFWLYNLISLNDFFAKMIPKIPNIIPIYGMMIDNIPNTIDAMALPFVICGC